MNLPRYWAEGMPPKLRLLIIEDSDDDAKLVEREFGTNGFAIECVRVDTREGLEAALADKVWDIAISDFVMPHFSGLDALKVIKDHGLDIPFIVVSGKMGEEVAVKVMKAGAHDYILKGNLSRLIPAVERELLDAQARRDRKEAERKLVLTRFSFENSSEPIFWITPDARFFDVNDAACRHLGYSREELLALSVHSLDNDYDEKRWDEHFADLRERGTLRFESTHHGKDGREIPVEVVANYLRIGEDEWNCAFVRDIANQKQAENKIRALLAEKELLLKEVHHRIKNNMNTIKGLLSLQVAAEKNPSAAASLRDAEGRVQSIMMLYDRLYCTDNYRELSVKDYLVPLTQEIIGSFPVACRVRLSTEIDDCILNVQFLTPLGILVNELLTNMMKHAFSGRDDGHVLLSVALKDGRLIAVLEDDGIGLPESVTLKNSTGFGMMMVGMLIEQLSGDIRIERNHGTRFTIAFDI